MIRQTGNKKKKKGKHKLANDIKFSYRSPLYAFKYSLKLRIRILRFFTP